MTITASMLGPAAEPAPAAISLFVPADTTDGQLVELWLHGKSPHTQRAYRTEAVRFVSFVARPLRTITLMDLQAYADSLGGAPATRIRALAAVKSLLTFGQRTGPRAQCRRGAQTATPQRHPRRAHPRRGRGPRPAGTRAWPPQRVLLRLLYCGGLRVSEIAGLCWRDLHTRDDGGQVTVFGKGGKTRTVLLPADVWRDLVSLRGTASLEDPVFRSRHGRHLDPSAIFRIVRHAAERAELEAGSNVSPHWLRHAHAAHALERGAPIHLVQATLGHTSVATTGRYLHARPTDSSARYTSG